MDRGNIIRSFQSNDSDEFLIVFQDLSIHYIHNGRRSWSLEQALSKIQQVEIYDQTAVQGIKSDELSYVDHMADPISLFEVP
jgi:hypothetical protein